MKQGRLLRTFALDGNSITHGLYVAKVAALGAADTHFNAGFGHAVVQAVESSIETLVVTMIFIV
jgi:acetamidase/formamidase